MNGFFTDEVEIFFCYYVFRVEERLCWGEIYVRERADTLCVRITLPHLAMELSGEIPRVFPHVFLEEGVVLVALMLFLFRPICFGFETCTVGVAALGGRWLGGSERGTLIWKLLSLVVRDPHQLPIMFALLPLEIVARHRGHRRARALLNCRRCRLRRHGGLLVATGELRVGVRHFFEGSGWSGVLVWLGQVRSG